LRSSGHQFGGQFALRRDHDGREMFFSAFYRGTCYRYISKNSLWFTLNPTGPLCEEAWRYSFETDKFARDSPPALLIYAILIMELMRSLVNKTSVINFPIIPARQLWNWYTAQNFHVAIDLRVNVVCFILFECTDDKNAHHMQLHLLSWSIFI